jgi:hypothetical protein
VLAFFGVPHGATDHLVAASIFRRSFPRCWLLVFVLVRTVTHALAVARGKHARRGKGRKTPARPRRLPST